MSLETNNVFFLPKLSKFASSNRDNATCKIGNSTLSYFLEQFLRTQASYFSEIKNNLNLILVKLRVKMLFSLK